MLKLRRRSLLSSGRSPELQLLAHLVVIRVFAQMELPILRILDLDEEDPHRLAFYRELFAEDEQVACRDALVLGTMRREQGSFLPLGYRLEPGDDRPYRIITELLHDRIELRPEERDLAEEHCDSFLEADGVHA